MLPRNVRHCARTNGETRVCHVKLKVVFCCAVIDIKPEQASRCSCRLPSPLVSGAAQLCQASEPSHHMRELLSGRGTRLLRPGCRREPARNWRDNLYLPRRLDAWTTSAAESTGGEGAQKGGRVGVASRTCAKARARAVTRSSSCTIANVCTLHHRRPASAPQ